MKRKASSLSTINIERPWSMLSIGMIASILLLLLPTSVLSFAVVGNELVRTREFSTKSTDSSVSSTSSRCYGAFTTAITTLSAAPRGNNHGVVLGASPTSSPAAVSSKDEQAVDEYLEFLDRRYRRLHEDRPTNEFAHLPSSVWKWLHQEDGTSTASHNPATNPATNTEDALYVLGVAGLASKKLLQKHQLDAASAIKSDAVSDNSKETAIDVGFTATNDPGFSPSSSAMAVTAESMAQTLVRLLVNRKALIKYQSKQFKEIVALLVVRGPTHMIRAAWKFCDGTRFVKRTLLLTITLSFLLFRTVSLMIAHETA